MLSKPASCEGCPLQHIGTGFMKPIAPTNGVVLLGEALGEKEESSGLPFQGRAGYRLNRLLEWAGYKREDFGITNTVWCRPPDNRLEGQPYERGAISHCRTHHWGDFGRDTRVVVPMGNVPLQALLGRKGILNERGYPSIKDGLVVIPTVHPSYIARGNAKWSAPFINDIQKAVDAALFGIPPQFTQYLLDPSPQVAYQWALAYLQALRNDASLKLAFDIETPGKGDDEDDADTSGDAPDNTWTIWRIGFSYRHLDALSIPWTSEYFATIRLLLGSSGSKVVWNAGFDVPRCRRAGFPINGVIHDGMVAWHILHSDLPKRLGFVATFTCPWQPAWKHLSGAKPAFYNATDADVEWESMRVIEEGLCKAGLWDVYERDVLQLDPILIHMQQVGMPLDGEIREDRAKKLAEKQAAVKLELEALTPIEARRIAHVYKSTPKDTTGLFSRPGTHEALRCPNCGLRGPRKDHYKRFVKKSNPCAGYVSEVFTEQVDEYYRLAEYTPSRNQLIAYHNHLNRALPLVWDRKERRHKISFNEEQMKKLILKFPHDTMYPLILDYRGLDKLAGTYIGRYIAD
jgi:uracil-DNA glycosylase family 4